MTTFVQIAAGSSCLAVLAVYILVATRLAAYPAPWSAPWETGGSGKRLAPFFNAAIRLTLLAGLVVAIGWPYPQGAPESFPVDAGLGWFPPPPRQTSIDLTWLVVICIVTAAAAAALLFGLFLRLRPRSHRDKPSQMLITTSPIEVSLVDGGLLAVSLETDPRRAVIACYAEMERVLTIRGLPRNREETALEYASRLLKQGEAPPAPLRSLTALFQVAGFSVRPVLEDTRQRAIDSLRAICASSE